MSDELSLPPLPTPKDQNNETDEKLGLESFVWETDDAPKLPPPSTTAPNPYNPTGPSAPSLPVAPVASSNRDFSGGLAAFGNDEELSLDTAGWSAADESTDSLIVLPSTSVDIEELDSDEHRLNINDLLEKMLEMGASDLHLSAKAFPSVRVNGDITPLDTYPRLTGTQIRDAITAIMSEAQQNKFDDDLELDFSYTLPGKSRFRVNVLKQQEQVGVVMRAIPWEIKTAEELGLPEVVNQFSQLPRGLVLVTGPTGSGKSTTLAAIIDRANRTRAAHIMTVEDPVEFVHEHQKSLVNQREVGVDTHSFAAALKHVLRQDPDIILVGEMRDLETISVALTAAETGHLVFGTLHTQSAAETITRIIDVFPEGEKAHVQTQLASSIQAIVSQALLKRRGGGRVAALEILIANDAIRNQIRQGKIAEMQNTMTTSRGEGMQTLDAELKRLFEEGIVEFDDAADKATNRKDFIASLGGEAKIDEIKRRIRLRETSSGW